MEATRYGGRGEWSVVETFVIFLPLWFLSRGLWSQSGVSLDPIVLALMLAYASLPMACSIADEREQGTLEGLAATPLSTRQLVAGKILGSLYRIWPRVLGGVLGAVVARWTLTDLRGYEFAELPSLPEVAAGTVLFCGAFCLTLVGHIGLGAAGGSSGGALARGIVFSLLLWGSVLLLAVKLQPHQSPVGLAALALALGGANTLAYLFALSACDREKLVLPGWSATP
jgi:ABC-type Na+ efflux pump permease subunit